MPAHEEVADDRPAEPLGWVGSAELLRVIQGPATAPSEEPASGLSVGAGSRGGS